MNPYHTVVVARAPRLDRVDRAIELQIADSNLFKLSGRNVTMDLLTDSGTGALSIHQLAAAERARQTYAGSESFDRFRAAVRTLTGIKHILPVHQGRGAERIAFTETLQPGSKSIGNTHFDTTRANVLLRGAQPLDLPSPQMKDPAALFKGDIDLDALAQVLRTDRDTVAHVLMTVTNNAAAGHPVSMANLRAVRKLCDQYDVPLWLDVARFAENAWLIHRREDGYADRTPRQIAQEMFSLADACLMSAKKDALAHAGGFIALRDGDLAQRCRSLLIATEGYPTYGGMTGRDMEIAAQGLTEVLEPDYLRAREEDMIYLARELDAVGVPTVTPTSMHAVYVDAAAVLPHLMPAEYPGQALACELYLEGGIRSCEIGSVFAGTHDSALRLIEPAPQELLRLAFPRRVYTRADMDYIVQTCAAIVDRTSSIPGCRIIDAPPALLHFEARFARLE